MTLLNGSGGKPIAKALKAIENYKEIVKGSYQSSKDYEDFMKCFDNESVDIIITDPPYPIPHGTKMNEFMGKKTKNYNSGFFYNLITLDKLKEFVEECFRVLKNNSHFFIMTNEGNLEEIISFAEDSGFILKNKIIWVKCRDFNDGLAMGRYFLNGYEYMLLFSKGVIEPINDRMNVLVYPPKTMGLNAKPKELWAHCISSITNKDSLIIDPFGGSDPLTRCKMHRLIEGITISNVLITTKGNDPAKWGIELKSTLFNWGSN